MLVIVGCCLFAWVSDIYRPAKLLFGDLECQALPRLGCCPALRQRWQ